MRAVSVHAQVTCILRVFMSFALVVDVIRLMLVLSALVVVSAVVIAFP